MKTTRVFSFVLITMLLVAVARVSASSETSEDSAASSLSAIAGSYACGFDSDSSYQAPGTNTGVSVGGIFDITIAKDGSITQSDATLSVGNGGAGPAVCAYASGTGTVTTAPFFGALGGATLNLEADKANSPLCPPGGGTIAFGPASDGLKIAYTNAAGFVGHGSCVPAAVPSATSFQCSYTVGDGSGLGTVVFSPKLKQAALFRFANIVGSENFPGKVCPFLGIGAATLVGTIGNWGAPAAAAPSCPDTPFQNVKFTTGATTIFITAPGISNASCAPITALTDPAAKLEATPTSLNFGTKTIGSKSTLPVTIKNSGTDSADVLGFPIFGSPPFDETNDCPETLAAGAQCTVTVSFTPTKKGKASGHMEITTDAKNPPKVPLVGSGQ